MAQFVNMFEVDLQGRRNDPMPLRSTIGEGDANGLRVGARVTSLGDPVSLDGQCVGKVIRADGATVPLTGTITGNMAYVVLDQSSCMITGPIQVAVMWVRGNDVTTLVIAYGTVVRTETGADVQPSEPIPDLTELLAEIDAMRDATAAANAAASMRVSYNNANAVLNANGLVAHFPVYEQGNIANGADSDTQREARVRTNFIDASIANHIVINDSARSWRTYIYYYDANKQYVTLNDSTERFIRVLDGYPYYRFVAVDITGGSFQNPIAPEDVVSDYTVCGQGSISDLMTSAVYVDAAYVMFLQNRAISEGELISKNYRVAFAEYVNIDHNAIIVKNGAHNYRIYIYYYDDEYGYISSTDYRGTYGEDYAVTLDNIPATAQYYRIAVLDYTNGSFNNPISADDVQERVLIFRHNPFIRDLIRTVENSGDSYPEYFDDQVASVTTDAISHGGLVGIQGCAFVFCTDIHWSQNQKHSPALVRKVCGDALVPYVVLGGDYIAQYSSDKQLAINDMVECMSAFTGGKWSGIYPIFGNHDRNSNQTNTATYMTKAETYRIINAWMSDDCVYGPDYFNFYFDDVKSKTRFICLDTGAQRIDGGTITSTARAWAQSVINVLDADWHIIVVAHWIFTPTQWDEPLVDGELSGHYTPDALTLFSELDAINAQSNKATVEAIIAGHLHCDADDNTSGGIPIVFTDTDGTLALGEYTATVGTVTEQCFDVMTIDYANKRIYCDRIGRGVSRVITY